MKYLFTLILSVLSALGFSQTVIHDSNAELRSVGNFSGIKVSGGMDIYVTQNGTNALAVSGATQEIKNNIETRIIDDVLVISYNNKGISINERKNLRIYISSKQLESIEASGACNVFIQGSFTSSALKLTMSGATELSGKVDIEDVDAKISGASTVKISGKIKNFRLDASGASDINSKDLTVDNFLGRLSGASDISLTVLHSISTRISGASSLTYWGSPSKTDINKSGASSVKRR